MTDTRLSARNQWFRVWLPYQFIKLDVPGPKHVYLPLNRNYKPLGYGSPRGMGLDDYVDYMDYRHQATVFSRDPHTFAGVWNKVDGLYLYNDNPSTQDTYFERLGNLMSRAVKLYGAPDDD